MTIQNIKEGRKRKNQQHRAEQEIAQLANPYKL
jgi:hypothetical protein